MKRDISTIKIGKKELVITVDNAGGIGKKKYDEINIDYKIQGYFIARTALMENMCVAKPLALNLLNYCGDDNWNSIIKGIEKALDELGLDVEINGSSESNFEMLQSAFGITVIGEKIRRKKNTRNKGYAVIGTPLVGNEVLEDMDKIISLKEFKQLLEIKYIQEILPVGSKGIRKEFKHFSDKNISCELNIDKSAGPSTCVIISYNLKKEKKLLNIYNNKFHKIIEV